MYTEQEGRELVAGLTPGEAAARLRQLGWSDARLAVAAGVTQPAIHRIRTTGAMPRWTVGDALVKLAQRELLAAWAKMDK